MSAPVDPTHPSDPLISIVIPVFNEKQRLPATLKEIFDYLDATDWTWEVLVSDDGSCDGTPERVGRDWPRCRLLRADRNRGKGAAVRRGMLAARGRYRLFSDADLSTPIQELEPMLKALQEGGYDIVIGSRALPDSTLDVRQPWWREFSGRTFNLLVRPLSGLPYRDTQCGFKLFRAEAARSTFSRQRCEHWAFDVEILMLAKFFKFKVLERGIRWRNSKASKVRLFSDAPRMLCDVL